MSELTFEILSVEETEVLKKKYSKGSKYGELLDAIDEMEVGQSLRLVKPLKLTNFASIKQTIGRHVKDKEYKIKTRELGGVLIIFKVEGIKFTDPDELPI